LAKNLTKKQEFFVAEYMTDFNATRAAIAAGYSEKGAEQTASQLLRNPKVAEEIAKLSEKRLKKLDLSAEMIVAELKKLAFYDPIHLFEDDGSVKRIKDIPEAMRKALTSFEVAEIFDGETGEQKHAIGLLKKIKVSDRIRALELLGRYKEIQAWSEKHEHNVKITLEALVCGSADAG
jgi:phage terminase small subunit